MKSKVRIEIHGVNIGKLYKILKKNQIPMFDICRQDYKTLLFTTYCSNQKKLIALLANSCYNINVVEYYGLKKSINFFKKRLGYIVGAFIFALMLTFSNFFVTDIKIYGNSSLSQKEITAFLKQNGVYNGAWINKVKPDQLSMSLSNKFDKISLVSVIKKGTSLIINIKEKQSLTKTDQCFGDIIAQKNGTVLEISVMEGTAKVKVGDSFKVGDVLIMGSFNDIYGNPVSCNAQGQIKAKIEYTATLNFENVATKYKRTGKSITNCKYSLLGWTFKTTNHENKFEHFETQEYSITLFKNNFLPIKASYTKYFETKPVKVEQNFEKEKAHLQAKVKKQAQELVPKDVEIVDQFEEIVQTEWGYQLKYTIETIEFI